MYINYLPVCIIHRPLIDIHESHYLRFARLYSKIIIRMLTNHTFVLTTPSWNIQFLINNIKNNFRCQQVNEEISMVFCFIGLHCLRQLPIESAASESHSYPGYQFPQGSDPLQYCHFYRQVLL
jgi:hypothetical protein